MTPPVRSEQCVQFRTDCVVVSLLLALVTFSITWGVVRVESSVPMSSPPGVLSWVNTSSSCETPRSWSCVVAASASSIIVDFVLRFNLPASSSPHILLYPFRPVHSYLPQQLVSHSSVGLPLTSYLSMCSQNSSFSCSVHPVFYHSFCENNLGPIIILSFNTCFMKKKKPSTSREQS